MVQRLTSRLSVIIYICIRRRNYNLKHVLDYIRSIHLFVFSKASKSNQLKHSVQAKSFTEK